MKTETKIFMLEFSSDVKILNELLEDNWKIKNTVSCNNFISYELTKTTQTPG